MLRLRPALSILVHPSRVLILSLGVGAGAALWHQERAHAVETKAQKVPRPLVVAGPSGVGKGTLIGRLMKDDVAQFGFSVSHTTRAPRPGEENGVHYHFVTREQFEALRAEGGFYEWNEYNGNLYGTSKKAVQDVQSQGKACVFDVDINGVQSLKKSSIEPVPRYVSISPPGADPLAVLRARLSGRGTESEATLERRLATARVELEWRDKSGYWDLVLINDNLETAYAQFRRFAVDEH